MPSDRRCVHVKKGGDRCRVTFGLSDDGFCWHHDPAGKAERQRARSRGGYKTAEKRRRKRIRTVDAREALDPPETLEDAALWASWGVWAVAVGEIDSRTAHEVFYGVNALQRTLEKLDIQAEVAALAEQVKALRERRGLKAAS